MKRFIVVSMLFTLAVFGTPLVIRGAKVGQPAPDFAGTANNNKTYHLADYHGKFVVLEWHNNGCPYTQKHYKSGNMQKLQKQWTGQGVIWFTIISSAPGKQGYVDANEQNSYMARMGAEPTAALLDPTGTIGHSYDAKTTPQMIIINPQGVVIYDGAIDNRPTDDLKDIAGATNYVDRVSVDSNGVVWQNWRATDYITAFDRRKCKVLNGRTATGQHCPEGWTIYHKPGPTFQGVSGINSDLNYLIFVDRHGVLGLGNDVPMTGAVNSDAMVALVPKTGQFVTVRIPYPLGYYTRSMQGRIDNPKTGWKGRGFWTSYNPNTPWHMEGGKGTKDKVVKVQMRPDPLAK